jgi:hypothetical protein
MKRPAANIQRSTHWLGECGPLVQFGISHDEMKARQNNTSAIKNAVPSKLILFIVNFFSPSTISLNVESTVGIVKQSLWLRRLVVTSVLAVSR